MNNLLSYCGLVDVRINASDKDLPVPIERIPLTLHHHEYIALDYLGPWYFYENPKAKGRKCYGLIVTCLVTRHVHLELVKSCSTNAFFLGLRDIPCL